MLLIKGKPFLPGFKQECFAEFEEKMFDPVDNGCFQIGFGIGGFFLESRKFKDIGIFYQVFRVLNNLPLLAEIANLFLVPT